MILVTVLVTNPDFLAVAKLDPTQQPIVAQIQRDFPVGKDRL